MKLIHYRALLVFSILFGSKTVMAMDTHDSISGVLDKCALFGFIAGFAVNIFTSEPKSMLEANTAGIIGTASTLALTTLDIGRKFKLGLFLKGVPQNSLTISTASGFGLGFASARIINMLVRNIYKKAKGLVAHPQKSKAK